MAFHNDLGKKGEDLAVAHLLQNGYKILATNWRYLKAEIDIIAQKDRLLVAVEVKTRATDFYGKPQDFVDPKKIKRLLSAIDNYVIEKELEVEVRFDIIAIIHYKQQTKIEHLKDAFLYF